MIERLPMIDFLLARIDEDDAAVRARGEWWPDGDHDGVAIRVWKPWEERRLAELEGRRLLVEGVRKMREDKPWAWMRPEWFSPESKWHGDAPYVLRCLALPYADHPDYREEWKP